MAIAGLRGTGDWGTDERPKNFREMILWLNPNGDSPLLALTSKMGKQSVNDPEFAWWEELKSIVRIQVNGSVLIGGTTINLDNGINGATAQNFKPGDLLLVEEGAETTTFGYEIVTVVTVPSATQITVTRATANSTATAISDDTWLTLIGSAYEEGSVKASATTRNPTKYSNLTQIFKNTYSITNTARATYARTGDVEKNDKMRKVFDHSTSMEMAFLFGKKYETTGTNGKPLRYTGGLEYFLANATGGSRIDAATAMSGTGATGINLLLDTLMDVFNWAPGGASGDERLLLCGNSAMIAVSKAAAASGQVTFGEIVKVYGMNVTKLVIPQGTFYLKTHPLMNQHPRFTTGMFVLNASGIKYRPLEGRDTKTEEDIQTPGQDSKEGQWLTECGLEFHFLQTMKYLAAVSYT